MPALIDFSALSLLAPCTEIWGGAEVLNGDLAVEVHDDAVYMPFSDHTFYFADPNWGIYFPDGKLIEAAALRQGPDRKLLGQCNSIDIMMHIERAPPGNYVYAGVFNSHYGHFICSSLARLWYLCDIDINDVRLVFHSHQSVADMFSLPFARFCFSALGLDEKNILVFDRPVRIGRLIVPLPSLAEQSFIHPKFRQLGHLIGKNFVDSDSTTPLPPVYLSKTHLSGGVGRLFNELVVESILGSSGVEIIYPERLNFPEQIRLFSQRRIVAGTIGSAFHTSIFSPPSNKMICFSGFNSINSNLKLIDKINSNETMYLYPRSGASMRSNIDNFQGETIVEGLESVARELANIIEAWR